MDKFNEQKFISICSHGKYQDIKQYLQQIIDAKDLLNHYQQIFEDGEYFIKTEDTHIKKFLKKYEDYLKWAFTNETTTDSCKEYIYQVFQEDFPAISNWEELEKTVLLFLKNAGYYAVFGVTLPYVDLYIWKTQNISIREVEIPEGKVKMQICEMSDVIASGWYDYISLHLAGAGGWVSENGAHYFTSKYDINSDEFTISLLKHEGQHFHDLKLYPQMKSCDLEYRAKLVELIYYKTPVRFFKFLDKLGDNPDNPHLYANKIILQNLSQKIFNKEMELREGIWKQNYNKVPDYAKILLEEHTKKLLTWNESKQII